MLTREDIQNIRYCGRMTFEDRQELCGLALLAIDSERARRVGEAVLELGEYVPFMIECAIGTIEDGAGFDDDALPRIRAFRATVNEAIRGEP